MGELASENLLFWKEGIKYKMNFDRNKDFEYTQQVGRVLYRTFVSKNAQLPINISGPLRDTIENRFRSGVVGKNVFDEALIEIYNMMQNGPFQRFIRSEVFQEFSKNKADFSLPTSSQQGVFNPMAIVPSMGHDEPRSSGNLYDIDIADYVHHL